MYEKIIQILSDVKENPTLIETVNESTNIIDDLGLESLQMITFILKLEDEFAIEIDFDAFDFAHLSSVKALAEFLEGSTQKV